MPNSKYLIVGGGMTADAAIHGIRESDRGGSISLIGAEAHPPDNRPPRSKGVREGKTPANIWRQSGEAYPAPPGGGDPRGGALSPDAFERVVLPLPRRQRLG